MIRILSLVTILLVVNMACSTKSTLLIESPTLNLEVIPQRTDINYQGYKKGDDETLFIFDPLAYDVAPERVSVTGSFRDWDQALDDSLWQLQQEGELFILPLSDSMADVVTSNSEFKFRIDDGQWMDPPIDAPNTKAGNLIFDPMEITTGLKAEIIKPNLIIAHIKGERLLDPDDYELTDAAGNKLPIAQILPNTASRTLVIPTDSLDIGRVYHLAVPSLDLKAWCSYDGWMRDTYSNKELGANISDKGTSIRVFAPRAHGLKLYLYEGRLDKEALEAISMTKDENGVWEYSTKEDLSGMYYDFTVHGPDEPGNMYYDTHPVHITDPYARVSDNTWGKARIWPKTKPASPLKNGIPALQDVIAYEVHVQDFTDKLPIADQHKGTFTGMITTGLTNERGEKIGFDYILDLGINTVHLMPVQEYLHFPDEDWKASFQDDPYMIEQGVSEENYQWGYRTSHFMAVESKYRNKGDEPGAERDQFRDLVQAFHDKDIAVIIDIVPNHTAENMDGNEFLFNFNALDKMYYYRTKDFDHIGEYGNEVKTENRPMVQRWLIDQCRHFIDEFGVDGFRIDLAGQIDRQTLTKLKDAIGHDKILYGEAWIGSNDPDFENNPDWDWYKHNSPITFFQDDTRNAFKGSVFELNDKSKDRGWPGGAYHLRGAVMKGLINQQTDDKTPLSGINYLDIHDNFALADQFGTHNFDGRLEVDQRRYKIAATLLYTSLGPIVTHGGSEIMRSKAHAPLREEVRTTIAGYTTAMHGYRDTYNHRTANQYKWNQVGATPKGDNKNDYQNMHAFWRGLNRLRLSELGSVFRVADPVPDDYYRWISPDAQNLLGYTVDDKIFVLINVGGELYDLPSDVLPGGRWKLIGTVDSIDHINGVIAPNVPIVLDKSSIQNIPVPAESLFIWVRE